MPNIDCRLVASLGYHHDDVDKRLQDHEARISRLEHKAT
jgi:hypothetical protein